MHWPYLWGSCALIALIFNPQLLGSSSQVFWGGLPRDLAWGLLISAMVLLLMVYKVARNRFLAKRT